MLLSFGFIIFAYLYFGFPILVLKMHILTIFWWFPRKHRESLAYHTSVLIIDFYYSLNNAKTSEHFYFIYTPPYLNIVFIFSIPQYIISIVLCSPCSLRILHIFTIFVVLYLFLHIQLSFWDHGPSA